MHRGQGVVSGSWLRIAKPDWLSVSNPNSWRKRCNSSTRRSALLPMIMENVPGREKLERFVRMIEDLNEMVAYLDGRWFIPFAIITLNNLDLSILTIGKVISVNYNSLGISGLREMVWVWWGVWMSDRWRCGLRGNVVLWSPGLRVRPVWRRLGGWQRLNGQSISMDILLRGRNGIVGRSRMRIDSGRIKWRIAVRVRERSVIDSFCILCRAVRMQRDR